MTTMTHSAVPTRPCSTCGTNRVTAPKRVCDPCTRLRRQRNDSNRDRDRYEKGICQKCPNRRLPDHTICPDCLETRRQAHREQYQEWLGRRMEGTLSDPDRPTGKMFFNILATFAKFEADLIRMRNREGMVIARAKGKLRGKQPKLSDRQQREPCRMHATGDCSISDLAELFSVSRPTVYRTLNRRLSPAYARFAQKYDQIQREHCTDDANPNREFDLALQILERTCECGNEKMAMPDGTLGDTCRQRQYIEDHGRHRRPHAGTSDQPLPRPLPRRN